MAILHSAISREGVLLSLFLICFTAFSAAAIPAGYLNAAIHQNYQDKKRDKTKKEEAQKPKSQRIDDQKQGPQKPEIKQVPKARKQLKPAAVKPKVKAVRIVKPKIKKP